ncbi:MAG: hypothetical protein ACTS43_02155 [Candidatus Hodgkinia cicadicola]
MKQVGTFRNDLSGIMFPSSQFRNNGGDVPQRKRGNRNRKDNYPEVERGNKWLCPKGRVRQSGPTSQCWPKSNGRNNLRKVNECQWSATLMKRRKQNERPFVHLRESPHWCGSAE